MKVASNNPAQQNSVRVKKNVLKEQGNIIPEFLYKIITKKDGKPDHIAIAIYVEVRSWFKLKKTKVDGNVIYSSKLKGHGFQTGYEHFVTKYQCTSETIRTKFVLLEELGLITRDFRTEYFYGKRFNNLMYILVWKDTPHFYSEIGLEKPKKVSTTYPENQGYLSQNTLTPIQKNLDNIYVIPNNHPIEELKPSSRVLRSSLKDIPVIEGNNTRACEPDQVTSILTKQKNNESNHTTCSNAILAEHSQVVTTKISQPVTDCDHPHKPKLLTASEEKAIHQERMERTCEPVGALKTLNFNELMSQIRQLNQSTTQEETTPMKQDDQNIILDKDIRKMLLSKAIFDAFGATANEIQDNCTFEELEPDRVGIKPSLGVSFNDIEKAKIRKAIKLVYGEEVKILAASSKPITITLQTDNESGLAKSEVVETSPQNNSQWLSFKANVKDSKVRQILNNPTLKIIEIPGKVIIEAHAFLLEELFSSGYVDELEDAVVETDLTLEFHEKTVASDYVIRDKEPTVLTKEKIMKDREWRKTATGDFDDFINELKAK